MIPIPIYHLRQQKSLKLSFLTQSVNCWTLVSHTKMKFKAGGQLKRQDKHYNKQKIKEEGLIHFRNFFDDNKAEERYFIRYDNHDGLGQR